MKTSEVDILLCVDAAELNADHWVERWSRNLRTGQTVDVGPLSDHAEGGSAITELSRAVGRCRQPVLLVGYHAGVAAIARAGEALAGHNVKGAFLVAPPAVKLRPPEVSDDAALSSAPLPFPSLMIASRSDARCSFDVASELALAWGSHLVDAGEAGQLDPSSGHGPWPEGLMRLGWFLKRL